MLDYSSLCGIVLKIHCCSMLLWEPMCETHRGAPSQQSWWVSRPRLEDPLDEKDDPSWFSASHLKKKTKKNLRIRNSIGERGNVLFKLLNSFTGKFSASRVENHSAIKKNAFESVLMRWMKLKPITQSEVSQKEKHQYSILMHIYGI